MSNGSTLPDLLVIGSQNANVADRTLSRGELHTLQILRADGEIVAVPFFDEWGTLGMSSMAWEPEDPFTVYLASDTELFRFRLEEGRHEKLAIPNLTDVHEITIWDDTLWIANTGNDEIVSYDLRCGQVSARKELTNASTTATTDPDPETSCIDRFHCNQVFTGQDGETYALVHHTSGKQLFKRVAQRFLKSQGNGGVISLTSGKRVPLNLKAPHNVRVVGDEYWIYDSGRFELVVYDHEWRERDRIGSRGFGRGADVDLSRGLFFGGISATRKRYMGLFPESQGCPNMIQIISLSERKEIETVVTPNVEQINNLYCIRGDVAHLLLNLGE